ncbi:hypothetical protein HNY73_011049 [Argiope bruennichi]|uniref:Uncharacterized protein n=1 Tax=Argiope bruennichi TaxID=94029 RepID=A0A8T0F2Z9_ARGBR|nr:hypothetical protein HNY73_011049 [Argiope bruennichi]
MADRTSDHLNINDFVNQPHRVLGLSWSPQNDYVNQNARVAPLKPLSLHNTFGINGYITGSSIIGEAKPFNKQIGPLKISESNERNYACEVGATGEEFESDLKERTCPTKVLKCINSTGGECFVFVKLLYGGRPKVKANNSVRESGLA